MPWLIPSVVATLSATIILFLAYLYLYWEERDQSLGIWALGWGLYAVRFVFMLMLAAWGQDPVLLIGNQLSTLWSGFFILEGAFRFSGRPSRTWWLFPCLILSLWIMAGPFFPLPHVLYSLPTFLLLGVIYIATGLIWLRLSGPRLLSQHTVGISFILWGLHKFDYPFLHDHAGFAPWGYLLGAILAILAAVSTVVFYFQKTKYELAASRERLRQVADGLPVLIAQRDREGRFLFVNRHYAEWLGMEEKDILGRPAEDILPPGTWTIIAPHLDRAQAGEEVVTETRLPGPKGDQRFFRLHYLPNQDGLVAGSSIYILAEDITARKKAEEAIQLSEEKFQKAFQVSPVWVSVSTLREGRFLEVNGAFTKLTGFTREEALGRTSRELGLWIDGQARDRALEEVDRTGVLREFEVRFRFKDGGIHDMLWSAEPFTFEGRKCLLNVAVDISSRKEAEESLRKSQERLRALVDNSSDAILLLDQDARLVRVNPAFQEEFGYSPEEILGRSIEMLHASPEAHQAFQEKVRSTIYRAGSWRGEWTFRDAQGRELPMETVISILRDPEGRVSGFTAIMRDIRARLEAEEQRSRLEIQLRQAQKMEALGTLAGGIAHDFNNILSAIVGYTELTMQDISEGLQDTKNLEQVLKAGDRARDLVRQILTFSRLSEQAKRPVDLVSITKEALRLLRSSLPTTIEIRQDLAQAGGTVMADLTQIHQVVMNLCTNAAQAMHQGGGLLEVSITRLELDRDDLAGQPEAAPGTYQMLSVSDNGRGIPAGDLDKIFEPYFTTKGAGEGTGLGLAVVHGIVKAHGGFIKVYSEEGKGSVFRIYLPQIPEAEEVQAEDKGPVPGGAERVLFVDDELSLAELGKRSLSKLGYRVTVHLNGLTAWEDFQSRPDQFDILVSDQTMPHMTGLELARRALELRPDLPVLLLTGFSRTLDADTARAAGVRELLFKPLVGRQLALAVRRVLDGSSVPPHPPGPAWETRNGGRA